MNINFGQCINKLKKFIIHLFLISYYDETTMWGNQTLTKLALLTATHGGLAQSNNFNIHKQV
jgi:hypothetical protein